MANGSIAMTRPSRADTSPPRQQGEVPGWRGGLVTNGRAQKGPRQAQRKKQGGACRNQQYAVPGYRRIVPASPDADRLGDGRALHLPIPSAAWQPRMEG